ncbi:DUF2878 domain-containing protein [Shewanella sp. MEBiC00475]|uniref:DUF2878 domain-containing protein n=1 Tax=Shewanella sp. MEBiC00475 TaxID=2575361 RepID=UPI0010BF9C6E|nr:DUF2878 domain-containing protein [Shewanella sp. MEBiC00475]
MSTLSLPPTLFIVINAVCFQLVWWAGVLGHNQLVLLSILLIISHFLLSTSVRHDVRVMCVCGGIGIIVDSLLTGFGVFEFNIIPYWLGLLWLYFALSLHYSLAIFRTFPIWLQSLLGGLFGCLSYMAGAKFDAVVLPLGNVWSVFILALIWSGLFPVLLHISHRITRRHIAMEDRR